MAHRFLWVTYDGAGLPLAKRLEEEGHEVVVFFPRAEIRSTGLWEGLITIVDDLGFLARDVERRTIIVFDHVGVFKKPVVTTKPAHSMGELADILRSLGFVVIGPNKFTERLELERSFGKKICMMVGIAVPQVLTFSSLREALQLLASHRGRWVFKPDNNVAPTYVAVEDDSADLIEHIRILIEDHGVPNNTAGILEQFVPGVEVSCEAWFRQGEWVAGLTNITLETKVAFPGQMGPAVGCSTSAVCGIYEDSKLVKATWEKLAPVMKEFDVTAPVDINTIVPFKGDTPVALEFCGGRFGYSAIFELVEILDVPLARLLVGLAGGELPRRLVRPVWGYGLRVWMPPAPWEPEDRNLKPKITEEIAGTVVWLSPKAPQWVHQHIWWQDVKKGKEKNRLALAGVDGTVAEITGVGNTITEAAKMAEKILQFLRSEHNEHWARVDGGQALLTRWQFLMSRRWVEPYPKRRREEPVHQDAQLTSAS